MVPRRAIVFAFFGAVFLVQLPHGQALAPLTVAPKNLVSARRGSRLLILLDLQPHRAELVKLPIDEAVALIVATAEFYADRSLSADQDHIQDAEVIPAFVENMDEYNRPNFGGMVRLGSVKFRRDGDKIRVTDLTIEKEFIK